MREYVCGKNSVLNAIENNVEIVAIYTSRPNEIKTKQIRVIYTKNNELDQIVKENHQGFIAELKEFNYYSLDIIFQDKPEKVLILDHIQDPHNLGAIIRSANASGVKHIIIPKDRAAKMSPAVFKVSAGGYVGIKIIRIPSIMNAMQKLKAKKFWIYASAIENGTPLSKANFNYPLALVVGNESKGISKAILKHTDQKIYIPMTGTVQSLNVSVAAGILLFAI